MGMFKDMKKSVKAASNMTEVAKEAQERAMAQQQAASQPVDPNDPSFAPIQGITIDKYAEISAKLVKNGVQGVEAVNEYAESMGVPAGAWAEVQTGWVARMGQSEAVRLHYGNMYSEYSK